MIPQQQQQQNNEQKYSAILHELLSGQCSKSYWTRKSRMQILQWEMSPLEFKILEFDVAIKFNQAKDLARSAKQLFQDDKSNEKVRQRIGQLFSLLMNSRDRKFSTQIVSDLSMEQLQEMFFYAFPEQRHSTKGSLQVYLVYASNQPHSLGTIATKLFANYLGASAEFQRGQKGSPQEQAAAITPMDAVIFFLFDSFVQANFGDLSIHNNSQIFQILLMNCFADSMGRVPEDFYSLSGIPCLSAIPRSSFCWHFCFPVLGHLFKQRGLGNLAKSLEPFPESTAQMTETIERAMAASPEIVNNLEFVRLALLWALASPIRNTQLDPLSQFVVVPANIFWINPSGLAHFWVYNLDAEDEDSPAEIEEPQREKKMRIIPDFLPPIRIINSLFSNGHVAQRELANLLAAAKMPNAPSIIVLALMASENWKKAAELAQIFDSFSPPLVDAQKPILRLQKVQTLIALRKLHAAFLLCLECIDQLPPLPNYEDDGSGIPSEFPAIIVSQDPQWVHLSSPLHFALFHQLLLFHIIWLAFAKFQSSSSSSSSSSASSKMAQKADFLFHLLILLAQSCWDHFGFGLFEQLLEHVENREYFNCPDLLSTLENPLILGQLLSFDHLLVNFSSSEQCYQTPSQILNEIVEGKRHLAGHQSPFAILQKFLAENKQKMEEILSSF